MVSALCTHISHNRSDKLAEFHPLLQKIHEDAHQEAQDGYHRRLVTHSPDTVLEAAKLFQFLVLVVLEHHIKVGDARRGECGYSQVNLIDTGQDDIVNDNEEAAALGLARDLL